jgi:hypothetical protein
VVSRLMGWLFKIHAGLYKFSRLTLKISGYRFNPSPAQSIKT